MGRASSHTRPSLPVIFTPLAQVELANAQDWYAVRSEHTARRFREAVGGVVERLRQNPPQFPFVRSDVRRALVGHHFPYALFFRTTTASIVVVACFHLSRDPRQWQRR
jgi:toxin ParE1/3/4